MKKVRKIRIELILLCLILIASINTIPLTAKAAGIDPQVIWLKKNYSLPVNTDTTFSEGLAVVCLNDKYGYIDKTGKEVIAVKYLEATPFSEGLAAVVLSDGSSVYIDKTGKQVSAKYDNARPFSEGLAAVKFIDRKYGYIDKTGKEVISAMYDDAEPFSQGRAAVELNILNRKYGYIDKTGNLVSSGYDYEIASPFSEDVAIIGRITYPNNGSIITDTVDVKCGLIDKAGNEIMSLKYDSVNNFSEGLAVVFNQKRGYIDKTGKEVISTKYDYAEPFSEGLAAVSLNSKSGYINKMGKVIISAKYGWANSFSEGLACVLLDDKTCYINKKGSAIISFKNDGVMGRDFKEGVAFVEYCGKLGIIKNPISQTAVISQSVVINPIKAGNTERLWGDNRYKTAVAISKSGWQKSDNVILVNGNNFPDALVGSSFAYLKDAPILITSSNKLDSNASSEIERLEVKNVYILGNNQSVSTDIENDLKQKYNVIRIGGTEVFDTAVKVGEEIRKIKQFDTVVIASQGNFPDALAIAPFSAMKTMPILFSDKQSLRNDTMMALQEWGTKNVVIVGGTGVISDAIDSKLKSLGITVTRLAGQDRYDTALEIIKHFKPAEGYKNISIATGESYPDALTGAVLAAKNNTPLVLVGKNSVKVNVSMYINNNTIDKACIFGGIGVVSEKVVGR